jgi:hypothetical protein
MSLCPIFGGEFVRISKYDFIRTLSPFRGLLRKPLTGTREEVHHRHKLAVCQLIFDNFVRRFETVRVDDAVMGVPTGPFTQSRSVHHSALKCAVTSLTT